MKFSERTKFIWWVIITCLVGYLLIRRHNSIVEGSPNTADIFFFLIFIALMLTPIFPDIEFFGIKLKREIDDLKNSLEIKFGEIKNEIRNTQNQTIHNTIHGFIPPPPKDEELPELQREFNLHKGKVNEYGAINVEVPNISDEIPDSNRYLFEVRFLIEREVKRIWENRIENIYGDNKHKRLPVWKMVNELSEFHVFEWSLLKILKEIISISNYGVHGETISDDQYNFVRINSEEVIGLLKRIK